MNWLYLLGGGTAALLLAYLTVALLKPERFS
jgi:K+-transporting ATPase KdpF subunit